MWSFMISCLMQVLGKGSIEKKRFSFGTFHPSGRLSSTTMDNFTFHPSGRLSSTTMDNFTFHPSGRLSSTAQYWSSKPFRKSMLLIFLTSVKEWSDQSMTNPWQCMTISWRICQRIKWSMHVQCMINAWAWHGHRVSACWGLLCCHSTRIRRGVQTCLFSFP